LNKIFVYRNRKIIDRHYKLLRKLLNLTTELPCLNVLTDLRAVFNINFKINSNYYGVYNSLSHKLKSVLLPIASGMNLFDESNILKDGTNLISKKKIQLKLGGDGTNLGRVKKLLNFNFTVLNEGNRCKTAAGNYSIG
jgi:hypothetical protein